MSVSSKRKRETYVDRSRVLLEKKKLPNVVPQVRALHCDVTSLKSAERRFKYKLCVADEPTMLLGMMLRNEICVLCLNYDLYSETFDSEVQSLRICDGICTNEISGKRKKGAKLIAAGTAICQIVHRDGSTHDLLAPVGGQLLELNSELSADLQCISVGTGFVAILYPDTEVPTIDGALDWNALLAKMHNAEKRQCFQWLKGDCTRGDMCKFKHIIDTDTSCADDSEGAISAIEIDVLL